jgi:signal transduction histidine kinase
MLEEVDHLTNLVDSLLRLSHADAGRVRLTRESVDLGALARDAVASLALLAEERNQQVRIHAEDTVLVEADRLLLREALTNVLDNAVKYSPPSSAIDVDVSESDGHAILTIADEGSGIAVEYRDRIFDRFFRVDEGRSRDAGGTGLGLSIAKWAVEVNGGQISVEGRDERGSVFRIELPTATVARGDAQRRGSRHHMEELT